MKMTTSTFAILSKTIKYIGINITKEVIKPILQKIQKIVRKKIRKT